MYCCSVAVLLKMENHFPLNVLTGRIYPRLSIYIYEEPKYPFSVSKLRRAQSNLRFLNLTYAHVIWLLFAQARTQLKFQTLLSGCRKSARKGAKGTHYGNYFTQQSVRPSVSARLGSASLGLASSCLAEANTFGSMPLMGKASEGDMAREWGGERVGGRGATRKWYAHWSALQYSC